MFVFGFAKRDRENISISDLADLRAAARITLALTPAELGVLVAAGKLFEVTDDEAS